MSFTKTISENQKQIVIRKIRGLQYENKSFRKERNTVENRLDNLKKEIGGYTDMININEEMIILLIGEYQIDPTTL